MPPQHTNTDTDVQFVASDAGKVHRGTLATGPRCTGPKTGNYALVDADTEAEAVLDYDLIPCVRCIDDHYQLERWRKDLHSALVMQHVDPPEKWKRKYDDWYDPEDGDADATTEGSA
jgi:hypothetical protein